MMTFTASLLRSTANVTSFDSEAPCARPVRWWTRRNTVRVRRRRCRPASAGTHGSRRPCRRRTCRTSWHSRSSRWCKTAGRSYDCTGSPLHDASETRQSPLPVSRRCCTMSTNVNYCLHRTYTL